MCCLGSHLGCKMDIGLQAWLSRPWISRPTDAGGKKRKREVVKMKVERKKGLARGNRRRASEDETKRMTDDGKIKMRFSCLEFRRTVWVCYVT